MKQKDFSRVKDGRYLNYSRQPSSLNLHGNAAHNDSLRSCDKFCSHGSSLSLDEINEILQGNMLAL